MKRRLLKLGLMLIAGAIVNIAVAWALAISIDVHARPFTSNIQFLSKGRWDCMHWRGFGSEQFSSAWQIFPISERYDPPTRGLVPRWSTARISPSKEFVEAESSYTEVELGDARGWPMLSLASEWGIRVDANGRTDIHKYGYELTFWPWKTATGATRKRMIPLRPIWPAFAVNTAIYAAILGFPFAMIDLRRQHRRRRGLCPACAYPIGTSPVCTECGAWLFQFKG